jgi:prepilin-type N-terminal cleavage/methylation domain-containing protein
MKTDVRQPAVTLGMGPPRFSERGFSALELLVVVVIVCVVIAIGVPTLHSRAKESVLEANLQSLGSLVNEQVMDGYSPDYRPSGEGDPDDYLSTHLEESLSVGGKAGYANPMAGSQGDRVVLNSSAVPTSPESATPAVLITDSLQCQYLSFSTLPDASRRLLAGTLVVAFCPEARAVDVFFVDANGQKSDDVVNIPTG